MKNNERLLEGYENTTLIDYVDKGTKLPNTFKFSDLPNHDINGVLLGSKYVGDDYYLTFSNENNHVMVMAPTRLGKTTSYIIPTILSFAHEKVKKSMVISDPKGEIYRLTAKELIKEGYDVKLLNYKDFEHSEYYNPLTPIYRDYKAAQNITADITVVQTKDGPRNKFNGVVYSSQKELDRAVELYKKVKMEGVVNSIDKLAFMMISTENTKDPYWEDSARVLLKAVIWAMLEDSTPRKGGTLITEDTFSFTTALSIFDSMNDDTSAHFNDNGYFSNRDVSSRAYCLAKNCILSNAPVTRKCIVSCFNSKLACYRSSAVRMITSCNSFKLEELVSDKPIAFFIAYHDEVKADYQVISAFIQQCYNFLINYTREKDEGKLEVPFYFILDEFANFPKIPDFEVVISSCAGRNIWFILVLQSYAQLNNVYGKDIAEIIKDNLNVHVFLGSNNPMTLQAISSECGEKTRISPLSALNGNKDEIDNFQIETIPLVTKSALSKLKKGECIVTEANVGHVLFSMLVPYYLCKEFNNLDKSQERDYYSHVNPLEDKYFYDIKRLLNDLDDFDF